MATVSKKPRIRQYQNTVHQIFGRYTLKIYMLIHRTIAFKVSHYSIHPTIATSDQVF